MLLSSLLCKHCITITWYALRLWQPYGTKSFKVKLQLLPNDILSCPMFMLNVLYILLKAPLRVCTDNTAQGSISKVKYSMRWSWVLYLSQDIPPSAVLFVYTNSGDAFGGILYFELLWAISWVVQYRSNVMSHWLACIFLESRYSILFFQQVLAQILWESS